MKVKEYNKCLYLYAGDFNDDPNVLSILPKPSASEIKTLKKVSTLDENLSIYDEFLSRSVLNYFAARQVREDNKKEEVMGNITKINKDQALREILDVAEDLNKKVRNSQEKLLDLSNISTNNLKYSDLYTNYVSTLIDNYGYTLEIIQGILSYAEISSDLSNFSDLTKEEKKYLIIRTHSYYEISYQLFMSIHGDDSVIRSAGSPSDGIDDLLSVYSNQSSEGEFNPVKYMEPAIKNRRDFTDIENARHTFAHSVTPDISSSTYESFNTPLEERSLEKPLEEYTTDCKELLNISFEIYLACTFLSIMKQWIPSFVSFTYNENDTYLKSKIIEEIGSSDLSIRPSKSPDGYVIVYSDSGFDDEQLSKLNQNPFNVYTENSIGGTILVEVVDKDSLFKD